MGDVATMREARVEPARGSLRDTFNGWFATHEVAWELAMAVMAIVYVALGFIVDDLQPGERPEIEAAELAMTGLFVLEFASRFLAARSRSGYLKGHWVDVIALGPPIRALRVLRLLRLLRLVRAFAGLYRAGLHLHGLANHKGFAWLLSAWLGVMVLCSAWMYIAEKGINKAVENPFDALWWGVGTLTTAGYGDVYPQTTEGRLAAMVLMLLGIGLFGAITATITSYLMSHDLNRVESKIDADAAVDRRNLALDQATQRTTTPTPSAAEGPSSAGGSLVDELERLAALHRSGDLTPDEFSAAKQKALGRQPINRPVERESPAAE